jgi:hypothetical protein
VGLFEHVCHVSHVPKRARACWCKKHRVEHKLFEIFEAIKLSWV